MPARRAVEGVARTLCLVAVALVVAQGAAKAEDDSLTELLIEKGYITEAELEAARQENETSEAAGDEQAGTPDEAAAGEVSNAGETAYVDEASKEKGPNVEAGVKGLRVTSADGRFMVGLGGRLQVDGGGFSGGLTPLGGGARLRRGRIITWGKVYEDWKYKFEVNFDGNGEVFPTDAWVSYDGFDRIIIKLGHQKVPFSQSSMSSSNWQVFQERALADGLIDTGEEGRRRLGATVGSWGHDAGVHWNLLAGVFGEGLTDPGRVYSDWGAAARLQVAPIAEKTRVIAIDAAFYYRDFTSTSTLRYATKPESSLASVSLIDTGTIPNADDTFSYNAGLTGVWGPFHAQGEYTYVNVRRIGAPELAFSGWYAQAGYFITGESRNFNPKNGKYGRIKPKGRCGAWEIAVRYSDMDLQSLDIRGGFERDVTAALNWWVNENVSFRLNYVRAMLEPNSLVLFTLNPPLLGGINENVNAYMGRVQIVF